MACFWARAGDPDEEIDGFEFYSDAGTYDPNQKYPRFDEGNGPYSCAWTSPEGPSYSAAFHTFDFSYDNYSIVWGIDGTPIRYSTKFSNTLSQPILCNNLSVGGNPYILTKEFPYPPMNIVANVAVQPPPRAPNVWSQNYEMSVQWIVYYQQIPCISGAKTVTESDLNPSPNFFNVFLDADVTVSGNVNIANVGALEVLASSSIVFQPGFTSAGYLNAQISTNPCNGVHKPIINDGGGQTNTSEFTINKSLHIINTSENLNSDTVVKKDTFDFNVFPVPAINNAAISFYLPTQNNVLIYINDVLGHRVLNVLNSDNLSSGSHQQNINLSKLSPGIYICTIRAGNYIQQKKLIVARP